MEKRKREQVLRSKRKSNLPTAIVLLTVVIVAAGLFYITTSGSKSVGAELKGEQPTQNTQSVPPQSSQTAIGPSIITYTEQGGNIVLSMNEITSKKYVIFAYKNSSKTIPMMIYVTPSGRIVVAVRLCEPCQSTTFTLEGRELVCDKCGTRWDAESLKGISGGCPDYPPAEMKSVTVGEKLLIGETQILNWKPRV